MASILSATGLAPGIDVIRASRQSRAQCVSIVRSAAAMELIIIGIQVRLQGMLLQQISGVLGV